MTALQAAIWGVCASMGVAWAQQAQGQMHTHPGAQDKASASLEAVTITATRRPSAALTTPATVTVIDSQQLQEDLVSDLRTMFRHEPGVAVGRDPRGRGGEAHIEVRGIGSQRLGLMVDGVRQPGGYVAAGANHGQLKLDVRSLSRVEVLKGPASSLYGSDALAGVVLFRTLEPQDFLDDGQHLAGSASAGFDGADDSRWANVNLAFRAGAAQNLVSVSSSRGHELQNHPDSALQPDPQDWRMHNVLLKSVLGIDSSQSMTLTAEHFRKENSAYLQSLLGPIAGGTRIARSAADDSSQRDRLGLAYRYTPGGAWFENLSAQIDVQHSRSNEFTDEARQPPGAQPAQLRESTLAHSEKQWSGSLQLDGQHQQGALPHRWVLGADMLYKKLEVRNDALQRTVGSQVVSKIVDGDLYPRKIAPDTTVQNLGVFVQDEIALLHDRLRITPSLRFDTYRITPHPDALFANANVAGSKPVGQSKTAWTPRLGLSYSWLPQQVIYANFVTGFRMPTYDQLNRIGRVPVASFIHDFIPNPNLKPERSRGLELGMRGQFERGSYEVAAFYNRYTDFIQTQMIAFIPPGQSGDARAIRTFQSRNIGEVEIYGIEAKGHLSIGQWLHAKDHWKLLGALQFSVGNDKVTNQPLNSIQPARLVAGLRWDERSRRWGAELTANLVAGKRRVNEALAQTGPTAPVPLKTSGYATADITAYWRLGKQVTLHLAIHNMFNRSYYDWSTVSHLTGNDPRLAAYSAPGRTAAMSLRLDF